MAEIKILMKISKSGNAIIYYVGGKKFMSAKGHIEAIFNRRIRFHYPKEVAKGKSRPKPTTVSLDKSNDAKPY
jgi:hypothetical protein